MTNYVLGADVSQFQPNWTPSSTYKYVFVRTGFGTSIPLDPYHNQHVKKARAANMLVGHYHFLRPGNIAQQANNFVKNSAAKPGEILVCDWESYPPRPGATPTYPTNAEKDQFIKLVKALAPKNKVMLYCNTNFWTNIDKTGYAGDGLWIAYYSSSVPKIQANWLIWQYSQSGGLDKNRARFTSISAMKAWANELNVVTPIPAPDPTPIVPVVEMVDGVELGPYRTSGTKIKWRSLYHNNNVQANSTCFCVTQAIAVAEARLKKLGVIKECLDFWQFGYGQAAAASADTHAAGGVVDVVQIDDVTLKVMREVGFTASWYRGPGTQYGNFSTKHLHCVLSGCPHVSAGAKAQINSQAQGVRHGKNGLANGGPDYGPKVAYITWQNAFKKYVTTTATQPDNTDNLKGTVPIMANLKKFRRLKNQVFAKSRAWHSVLVDDSNNSGYSLASGPGAVHIVSTINSNEDVWARFATFNWKPGEVKASTLYPKVLIKAGGGQIELLDVLGGPAKGYKQKIVRLQICPVNGATVTDILTRVAKD